jgi:hypothetical protein
MAWLSGIWLGIPISLPKKYHNFSKKIREEYHKYNLFLSSQFFFFFGWYTLAEP